MVRIEEVFPEEAGRDFEKYLELAAGSGDAKKVQDAILPEVDSLFFRKDGEALSEREIIRRVAMFRAIINAKLDQLVDVEAVFNPVSTETFQRQRGNITKLFQRIFTDDNNLQNFDEKDAQDYIRQCIVDPRKITDTLLTNLGLEEYLPKNVEKRRAEEEGRPARKRIPVVEQVEMRAEAINHIKRVFADDLEEVSPRVFRMKDGDNEGQVLYARSSNGSTTLQRFPSIHAAHRKVDHERAGYEAEIVKLDALKREIDAVREEMINNWEELRDSGRVPEIEARIVTMVDSLEHVSNEHKVNLRERIAKAMSIKDSRGQLNPASRITMLTFAKDFFGKRHKEMQRISSHHSPDQMKLFQKMTKDTGRLEKFGEAVREHGDKLRLLDVQNPIPDVAKQRIITNLRTLKTTCESFEFHPYRELGARAAANIDVITALLNLPEADREAADVRGTARNAFVTIFAIAKFMGLEHDLLKIRTKFFRPGSDLSKVYVKDLIDALNSAAEKFGKKVAPDVDLTEWYQAYVEIYEFLGVQPGSRGRLILRDEGVIPTAKSALKRGVKKEQRPDQRVAALQEVDQMLKEFDPTKFLSQEPEVYES